MAAPEKTSGTLLRRVPLTETSLIVHWLSPDHGLLKTVAKGARRPKSPFAGRLDLFYRCEFLFVPARRGDLQTLTEVTVIDSRSGLRASYPQSLAAAYFVKLIEQVAEPGLPVPELEDLLERGLNYLASKAPDWRAIRHFERQLAEALGLGGPEHPAAEVIRQTFGELPAMRWELRDRLWPAGGAKE
ncbi:MAG: DNA repair protein RecO [Verrucomicrobiales bacterium]|nr:DNA repair protein RecO [Verrucomicrobiales bacterium]